MIENAKNAMTSLVLSRAPRTFRRRSIQSFPMFRNTSQTRAVRIRTLMLTRPKKKIELTNGSELEIFVSRNSANVSTPNNNARKAAANHSLCRFAFSRNSAGSANKLVMEHPRYGAQAYMGFSGPKRTKRSQFGWVRRPLRFVAPHWNCDRAQPSIHRPE